MGNILLSGARVFYAATSATLPSDTTVAYGAAVSAWTGADATWKYVGYTNAPATLAYTSEVYEVVTEQTTQAVETIVVSESAKVTTALIEWIQDNLALAFPGSTTTAIPAGAAQKAVTQLKAGGSATRNTYLLALEGGIKDAANVTQPVRFFFYRAQPVLTGDLSMAKNKEAALTLEWTCLNDETKTLGQQLMEVHIVTGGVSA